MEYCSALKREEVLAPETRWINLEDVILSERSQPQKYKTPYDSTNMKYLELAIHRESKLDVSRG